MDNELVSVIIPSYNRFKYLLNAIKSVKVQTYKNVEIIVVNDCSTQKEYYEYDFKKEFGDNLKIKNLEENSRKKYKIPSPAANARNVGIEKSKGQYIAFLDDDDIWLPEKLQVQIKIMKDQEYDMVACQSYMGNGVYNSTKKYRRINEDIYYGIIKSKFHKKKSNMIDNGFPDVFTLELQTYHNCLITSSIIMKRDLINKTGMFNLNKRNEDADYWRRALANTNGCLYVKEPLTYYDNTHGDGRNY